MGAALLVLELAQRLLLNLAGPLACDSEGVPNLRERVLPTVHQPVPKLQDRGLMPIELAQHRVQRLQRRLPVQNRPAVFRPDGMDGEAMTAAIEQDFPGCRPG